MAMRKTMSVADFRNHVTEVVREVEETKEPVIITRRGTPAVEIRPVQVDAAALLGSAKVAPGVDLTAPVVDQDEWEMLRG